MRKKWMSATALVLQLQLAKKEFDLQSAMNRSDKYLALIVDDIGYVRKNDTENQTL